MINKTLILIFILLILYILNAFLFPFPKKNVPNGPKPQYGFSYSFENTAWYGLDPKKSLIELYDCCKFSWVRLPFYWDNMVNEDGELIIEDLKFAITEAKKRNIKVVIALGLKTPYYPEYHLPKRISDQLKFGQTIDINYPAAQELLKLDQKLVLELSRYDNIAYWQVENEPLLANINNIKINPNLIAAEVDLIRKTDPMKRPIILSHVGPSEFDNNWKMLLPILKPGDILGVNAYFKTQGVNLLAFKLFGHEYSIPWPKGFVWPVQSWYFLSPNFDNLRKQLESQGNDLWILEMQSDPYIRTLEDAKKTSFYFKAEDIIKADIYIKQSRIKSIGFWGSSFWLYRKSIGDSSWLDTVFQIVK